MFSFTWIYINVFKAVQQCLKLSYRKTDIINWVYYETTDSFHLKTDPWICLSQISIFITFPLVTVDTIITVAMQWKFVWFVWLTHSRTLSITLMIPMFIEWNSSQSSRWIEIDNFLSTDWPHKIVLKTVQVQHIWFDIIEEFNFLSEPDLALKW